MNTTTINWLARIANFFRLPGGGLRADEKGAEQGRASGTTALAAAMLRKGAHRASGSTAANAAKTKPNSRRHAAAADTAAGGEL